MRMIKYLKIIIVLSFLRGYLFPLFYLKISMDILQNWVRIFSIEK